MLYPRSWMWASGVSTAFPVDRHLLCFVPGCWLSLSYNPNFCKTGQFTVSCFTMSLLGFVKKETFFCSRIAVKWHNRWPYFRHSSSSVSLFLKIWSGISCLGKDPSLQPHSGRGLCSLTCTERVRNHQGKISLPTNFDLKTNRCSNQLPKQPSKSLSETN